MVELDGTKPIRLKLAQTIDETLDLSNGECSCTST